MKIEKYNFISMRDKPKSSNGRWLFIWVIIALRLIFGDLAVTDAAEQKATTPKQPVVKALCDKGVSSNGVPVNGLQIALSVDKSVYRVGEQIQLNVRFVNRGDQPFRIFDSREFWGADIIILDEAGNEVSRRGGYSSFSPKLNYFMGTTHELAPGSCFDKQLRAWVDQRYMVVFGGSHRTRTQPLSREVRVRLGVPDDLPDDFIGTGHIFELKKPGTYRLQYHYAKTEIDRHVWRFAGSGPAKNAELLHNVWTGAIDTNQVMIEIKDKN